MDSEQPKRVTDDRRRYDDAGEDGLRSMLRDFYSRKMWSIVLLVWVWAVIFCCGAVFSAVKFFRTDLTRSQIMYAALFVCFVHGAGLMKVFAWGMIHRRGIRRQIRRLELRIAELTESLSAGPAHLP